MAASTVQTGWKGRWAGELGRACGGRVGSGEVAVPASGSCGDGAGDGGEHRLFYAVLGRSVMRLGLVGIEENFGYSAVVVGGQPRRVGDGRGTSVKEDEQKRGEKRREGKNGGGG
ncbi:hypothetical protein CRG98_029845 [Punica granatum]|uniref:Uncharacterized protein n=1 Tax=Punica granatum TaxID=22663 RepID=A0A2I0J0I8_PUNGR|nr:hypothetical protein CRG98_029845 [Punica granatum]